eukprot:6190507-Pleurochrysis_carterae.AAC.1
MLQASARPKQPLQLNHLPTMSELNQPRCMPSRLKPSPLYLHFLLCTYTFRTQTLTTPAIPAVHPLSPPPFSLVDSIAPPTVSTFADIENPTASSVRSEDAGLSDFLSESGLSELQSALPPGKSTPSPKYPFACFSFRPVDGQTLSAWLRHLSIGRTALLQHLKASGVSSITHRQRIAKALAAYARGHGKPLLVCFYAGGMTAAQGREHLRKWLTTAAAAGLDDQVIPLMHALMELVREIRVKT